MYSSLKKFIYLSLLSFSTIPYWNASSQPKNWEINKNKLIIFSPAWYSYVMERINGASIAHRNLGYINCSERRLSTFYIFNLFLHLHFSPIIHSNFTYDGLNSRVFYKFSNTIFSERRKKEGKKKRRALKWKIFILSFLSYCCMHNLLARLYYPFWDTLYVNAFDCIFSRRVRLPWHARRITSVVIWRTEHAIPVINLLLLDRGIIGESWDEKTRTETRIDDRPWPRRGVTIPDSGITVISDDLCVDKIRDSGRCRLVESSSQPMTLERRFQSRPRFVRFPRTAPRI